MVKLDRQARGALESYIGGVDVLAQKTHITRGTIQRAISGESVNETGAYILLRMVGMKFVDHTFPAKAILSAERISLSRNDKLLRQYAEVLDKMSVMIHAQPFLKELNTYLSRIRERDKVRAKFLDYKENDDDEQTKESHEEKRIGDQSAS